MTVGPKDIINTNQERKTIFMRKSAILMTAVLILSLFAGCNGDKTETNTKKSDKTSSISSTSSVSSDDSSESEIVYSSEENRSDAETSNSNRTFDNNRVNSSKTSSTLSDSDKDENVEKVYEKPITENTAILYNPQSSSYDKLSEEKRISVINAPDTVKPNGETRYISYKGNDDNDGKTPATAWATAKPLVVEDCNTVLFERGGIYRGLLKIKSDTSYGAYGSGPKPVFYTGAKNYADKTLWKQTPVKNIWEVRVGSVTDIGNVIFDNGKKIGMKVLKTYKNLKEDYQFYHHSDNGVLYLYLSEGNPGELFNSIEIAYGHGIQSGGTPKNIVIENLCVKYAGLHGISFRKDADNIIVRGCEIGYIGGSMSEYGRLGNGIEFVNSYSNCTVENCWIYQCYDAGVTFQNPSGTKLVENNMVFTDNLIEYCLYNVEIYTSETNGLITNSYIANNILRFAGYGWGTHNRIGSTDIVASHFNIYKGNGSGVQGSQNFIVENNIFDTSIYSLVAVGFPNNAEGKGPTVRNNTYIQRGGTSGYAAWIKGTDESSTTGTKLPATTQQEFEQSIKEVDSSPKSIILE